MAKRTSTKTAKKHPENPPKLNTTMKLREEDANRVSSLANTVVYIHGIHNKPPESVLRCQWDHALFGHGMGDRTRMAYWVDQNRYPKPYDAVCTDPDVIRVSPAGSSSKSIQSLSLEQDDFIKDVSKNENEQIWLNELDQYLEQNINDLDSSVKAQGVDDWLFGLLTLNIFSLTKKVFLADVHEFFFDEQRRKYMEDSLRQRLDTGGGPFVVISHSQGTMIAYKVLQEAHLNQYEIPLFVTIGSPLGLPPVRSRFSDWTHKSKLPFPKCVKRWVNIANRGDIVCADRDLTDDIDFDGVDKKQFVNYKIHSPNHDFDKDKHSSTGYLKTTELKNEIDKILTMDFQQLVGLELISQDVVKTYESIASQDRTRVLIELRNDKNNPLEKTGEIRKHLLNRLTLFAKEKKCSLDDFKIDEMRRFVSAKLTRDELERLRTEYRELPIHRVWRDAEKKMLIYQTRDTVQITPANTAYNAEGKDITWAVLDTGIDANHLHFTTHQTVLGLWDCTLEGKPAEFVLPEDCSDKKGHGTHVAGIIAGEYCINDYELKGMAPLAKLLCFKVLNDEGKGNDSYIIKALDKIAELNEQAGRLVVHGVNLSLGGDFDPSSYACGHTPLCKELRRLWQQGVIVVIAAGNEGFDVLRTANGQYRQTNFDLSINDPANLEEAIVVGSVHRTEPHSFGVSFFSSRGPTADGRIKPDIVAPGEKIFSAKANAPHKSGIDYELNDLYIQYSGTSMAAPHVSGILAAFLSIRTEFIGYPDKVKELLVQHATDLKRDRYQQGAGMPNIITMLVST